MKYFTVLTLTVAVFMFTDAKAQWGGDASKDKTTPPDSAEASGGWGGSEGGGWGGSSGGEASIESSGAGLKDPEPYKPEFKKFEKFSVPFDTNRELVFYQGVIEDNECVECSPDSLYYRAKLHLLKTFGKEKFKSYVKADKKTERIELLIRRPMLIGGRNANVKTEDGLLEYRLTLQFRDNRYKYQFGNFVHERVEVGDIARVTRTYHEYYRTNKKGFNYTDQFLIAADTDVKKLIEGLKKSLKEAYNPLEAGEDDW